MTVPDWLSFLLADTSALQLVFWVIAIGALIAVIVKLWPFMRNAVQIVDALVTLPALKASVEKMQAQVTSIHHELHPNGGTSMNDAVRRMEGTTERLEIGVKGLYDQVADLAEADKRLEAADERIRADFEQTNPPKEQP